MNFNQGLNYNNIVLTPNFSTLPSRSLAGTSLIFGNKVFELPICPANMVCCISTELAYWLSEHNYFYVMHRFDGETNKKDLRWFIEKANTEMWHCISISIGVQEEDYELLWWINVRNLRVDFITIDISHGHCLKMKEMLEFLNKEIKFKNKTFVIAGNIGTREAVSDLEIWGADATKVGLAFGKACITKNKTGFASPMFSTILLCSQNSKKPIIADGSISENGDITKALVAGATMVMAGNIFAACVDSPAESIYSENGKHIVSKKYFGSASKRSGKTKNIEGTEVIIECNDMTYNEKLEEIKQDLQSSLSFTGHSNKLEDLKRVEWKILQ
jgi:GMP reductase